MEVAGLSGGSDGGLMRTPAGKGAVGHAKQGKPGSADHATGKVAHNTQHRPEPRRGGEYRPGDTANRADQNQSNNQEKSVPIPMKKQISVRYYGAKGVKKR